MQLALSGRSALAALRALRAYKKTGKAKITVTTAAGASTTFTVKVQSKKVTAKKIVGFKKTVKIVFKVLRHSVVAGNVAVFYLESYKYQVVHKVVAIVVKETAANDAADNSYGDDNL